MKKQKNNKLEIIGFLIDDENFIQVVNPCSMTIEQMESAIKEHKKRKNKSDVTTVCYIKFPFEFPK